MAFTPRTVQEIIDEMLVDKASRPELNVLTNPSNVSTWYNLISLVATEVNILENEFEDVESDLETRSTEIPTGTPLWYQAESLEFQYGDTLIIQNGIPVYAVDDDTKKIVKVSSVTEQSGTLIIKVAAEDVSGNAIPLTAPEKAAFQQYWIKKRFAGTTITVISQDGDEMRVYARIEVDGQKITATGESQSTPGTYPVEDAIRDYIKELNFNGRYTVADMVNAIQVVDGVGNVVTTQVLAKQTGASTYVDVTLATDRAYIAVAGYLIEDTTIPFNSSLTYVIE